MYLVRDIFYCKPGKVRPMVEKFKAMNDLSKRVGFPIMRIYTDFCAEQYWTIVVHMEVETLDAFANMMPSTAANPDDLKEFEKIMADYHDLVMRGKREIYKVEA